MKSLVDIILFVLVISSLLLPVETVNGQVSSVFVRDYPQEYIVQEGDTITRIAGKFLADSSAWSDFWQPTPFRDSDRDIQAGDVVRVEFINGRARLVAKRGNMAVQRLAPQMREIGVTTEIPAIPLDDIQSSFTSNRIVAESAFDEAPYILSSLSNNLVIGTGDEIFARGDWPAGVTNFDIYREVNTFSDPLDIDKRSVELAVMGSASLVGEETDEVKRLRINRSGLEIKVGDRLLLGQELMFDSIVYPTKPDLDLSGKVVAMTNTERMASQLDTVLIDLGTSDGVRLGHVLAIKQTGDQIVDSTEREKKSFFGRIMANVADERVDTPRKQVGSILIYQTFDNLSYGLILSSSEPTRLGDMVVSP